MATNDEDLQYSGIKLATQGTYIRKTGRGRNVLSMTYEWYRNIIGGTNEGKTKYEAKMPDNIGEAFEIYGKKEEIDDTGAAVKTVYLGSFALSGKSIMAASMPFREMQQVDPTTGVKKKVVSQIIPKNDFVKVTPHDK